MSQVCFGIAGRLFGHNYEARYTEAQSAPPGGFDKIMTETSEPWKVEVLHAATLLNTTYHGDVCTRCGHTVNAPKEPQ